MKNLTSVLLLFCLLSSFSYAEIFMPLKVGDITVMIPIGPIQESEDEESSKTPLGKDDDNDGVRDDVQQNIVAKYGTNSPIATWSLVIARKYQKILSGNLTAQQINQQIADAEHLNSCIQNTTGTNTDGLGYVVPLQLNTVERSRAYLTAARDAYHEAGPPSYKSCGNSATSKSQLTKEASKINAPDLSDYDVYFINGVNTNEDKAVKMNERLQTLIKKNPVELLWNKNDTLKQYFDLYVEKIGEVNVDKTDVPDFWNFVLLGSVSPAISGAIWWATQRWMEPDRDVGYWSEQDLEEMIKRIKESLENKRKTLVVSHSQGNFFYRNIHQAIDQWDTDKTKQCFAGIGFAPPLSSKPGNFDYITNKNDKVINTVRDFWGNTLGGNVTVPEGYNDNKNGHGLLETYLDHPAPLKRFETELKQAVKQIDESCTGCAEPVGKSGRQGKHQYTYALKDTSAHKVEISFEAYSVPDKIRITANGKTIAKTNGLVSGFHQWQIDYDPKVHGTEFIAHVDAPDSATKWKLCIDCEGSDCGSQIERKKVSYLIRDANDIHTKWVCGNHRIDGQSVPESGAVQLSKGQHKFSADCWCTSRHFCGRIFGNPSLRLISASCGSEEECSFADKRDVMFEVY
ncbi:hypothetical protein N2382_02820 [SAR92 clade bacterium H921]|nr:hypothetical protein [SAR92 clade bacterium H921]